MRHVFLVVLVAVPAFAQQSFFNVPSGTRTTDHHIFLQAQFNVGAEGADSNLTAATGIAGGLELGFNIFHVDLFGDAVSHSARNLFMVNAVYTRELLHWLSFQVGGQAGVGRFETDGRYDFAGFGWALARFDWHEARLAGVVGGYGGTASHLGPGWPAGPMAAMEWTAIPGWLALQADLVFGNHESAVAVVGRRSCCRTAGSSREARFCRLRSRTTASASASSSPACPSSKARHASGSFARCR